MQKSLPDNIVDGVVAAVFMQRAGAPVLSLGGRMVATLAEHCVVTIDGNRHPLAAVQACVGRQVRLTMETGTGALLAVKAEFPDPGPVDPSEIRNVVFHCDLSTSDALSVSVGGSMATKEQLEAVLNSLNESLMQGAVSGAVHAELSRMKIDEDKAG